MSMLPLNMKYIFTWRGIRTKTKYFVYDITTTKKGPHNPFQLYIINLLWLYDCKNHNEKYFYDTFKMFNITTEWILLKFNQIVVQHINYKGLKISIVFFFFFAALLIIVANFMC